MKYTIHHTHSQPKNKDNFRGTQQQPRAFVNVAYQLV